LSVMLAACLVSVATSAAPAASAETNELAFEFEPGGTTNGAADLLSNSVPAVETNATDLTATFSTPGRTTAEADEQTLRSYLEVQAKLHSTLLAIEQARHEASASSASNAAALTDRLRQLEHALAAQRDRERDLAAQANRTLLIAAGGFAALGIVALGLVVFFQMRGMNRLAEIATAMPTARALGMGLSLPAPDSGSSALPGLLGADGDSARLLGVIGRLERRIVELEHTVESQPAATAVKIGGTAPSGNVPSENAARVRTLMGKAQALADLGHTSDAVECFDAILGLEAAHPPALLGKARALERQGKLAEAIACSDEALAADETLAHAWLLKARLLQQLGRDKEALSCYERALPVQDHTRSGG
jgi:tetratricopeptide (TPR) repeat protein